MLTLHRDTLHKGIPRATLLRATLPNMPLSTALLPLNNNKAAAVVALKAVWLLCAVVASLMHASNGCGLWWVGGWVDSTAYIKWSSQISGHHHYGFCVSYVWPLLSNNNWNVPSYACEFLLWISSSIWFHYH